MLCGRLPVEGDEVEVMQRITQGRLTPPWELNPGPDDELIQIIQEALAPQREARTPGAEALQLRRLDPEVSYTLEIQAREGVGTSPVAVLAVPRPGEAVEVSGQVSGDFRYVLAPGRYTLWGARELWFALTRWQHAGREVEMEVSLTPPASEDEVRVPKP
jgi:serine/threonine-protein kinase